MRGDGYRIVMDGKVVSLTGREFAILAFLLAQPGRVFHRREILDGLHGERYAIADRAIDVQLVGLRRKLGPAAKAIEAVRGEGYRLVAECLPSNFRLAPTASRSSSKSCAEGESA
jgi:two-component system phosphate regulon response regulator PhoB